MADRGRIGYQGAGSDPLKRFGEELAAAGGHAHFVTDSAAAVTRITELVQAHRRQRILLGHGEHLDRLALDERFRALGLEVTRVDALTSGSCRESFFAADIGISGVAYLVAETGTVVVRSQGSDPRSISLLPPVHIAVAGRDQLLPDLFDLFEKLPGEELPSCLTLITGPSKTGDIELKLVTGVHGPGEVHVVVFG